MYMPPLGNPLQQNNPQQATPGVMRRALTEAMPMAPDSDVPISPEQRAELEKMITEVDNAMSRVRRTRSGSAIQTTSNNEMMQRQIFELLQMGGVDLTNPESVRQFIDTVYQTNPDVGEVLEMVLEDVFKNETYENNEEDSSVPPVQGVSEAVSGFSTNQGIS